MQWERQVDAWRLSAARPGPACCGDETPKGFVVSALRSRETRDPRRIIIPLGASEPA